MIAFLRLLPLFEGSFFPPFLEGEKVDLILNDLLGFCFVFFCFCFFGGGSGIEPRTLCMLINTHSPTELPPQPFTLF